MTDAWALLDVMLRAAAVSLLFACAMLFNICPANRQKSLSIAGLGGALIAYLLVSSPNVPLPSGLSTVLILIAGTTPVWVYWASVEIFHDDVAFPRWQIAIAGLVVLAAWLADVVPFAALLRGVLVILLFAHLLYVVVSSAEGDLIEERRRFRRWFLAAVILLVLVISVFEVTGADQGIGPELIALHAGVFLLLAMVFLLCSARVSPDVWFRRADPRPRETDHPPADIALAAKVRAALEDGLWREEKLTIGILAQRLGTQEHRLRRTINRVLGHRNFPAFINGYRIAAAQRELGDPDKAEKAILTIAYDVGFASVGPFNRAFRAATGLSPSEYRKRAIKDSLRA